MGFFEVVIFLGFSALAIWYIRGISRQRRAATVRADWERRKADYDRYWQEVLEGKHDEIVNMPKQD